MGLGWCCLWIHSPAAGTMGRRDAMVLQDVEMSLGGGCSRAVAALVCARHSR